MSKFCAKCGADIAPKAGFCPLCGFAANAKLPAAVPEKKAEQPQPKANVAQPKKSKKSPLGIISIVVAVISTILSIILFILLLLPDNNKCDFCDEKASGDAIFVCDKCRDYIEQNIAVETYTPSVTEHDKSPDKDSSGSKPPKADSDLSVTDKTTKPNTEENNHGGVSVSPNEVSTEAATADSAAPSKNSAESSNKKTDIKFKTEDELDYNGCVVKLNKIDVDDNTTTKVNFKVASVDPEFSKKEVYLTYRTYDENGNVITDNIKICVTFKDVPKPGDVSTDASIDVKDGTSTVEFYVVPEKTASINN